MRAALSVLFTDPRQDANLTSERTCLSHSEHVIGDKTNANTKRNEYSAWADDCDYPRASFWIVWRVSHGIKVTFVEEFLHFKLIVIL